jgi:small multidrug resistance pump
LRTIDEVRAPARLSGRAADQAASVIPDEPVDDSAIACDIPSGGQDLIAAYLFLSGAIVAEVLATSLLKHTDGFSRLWPTLACLLLYGCAFFLLAKALTRGMHVGIGYAVWSAVGTTVIVTIGILVFHEPISTLKIVGVVLVVVGVVTLNLAATH